MMARTWSFIQKHSQGSSLGSHLLITMTVNLTLALLGVVSGSLAARALGPVGRGELAAIQTWPTFLASLSMLGLSQAVVFFSARRPDRGGRVLTSAMVLALLSAVPFALVGFWLMPTFLSAQTPEVVATARFYLLIIPLFSLAGLPQHTLRGRSDLMAWNLMRLGIPLGWVALLVLATFLEKSDPTWLAIGYLILYVLYAIPATTVAVRRIPAPFQPEPRLWVPMMRYGLPLAAASVPSMLSMRIDQMVMVALLAPELLGLYAVAVSWGGVVFPLLSAVGIVLFPRVASQSTTLEGLKTLAKGLSFGTALGLLVGGIAAGLTPIAVPLVFGVDFKEAVPPAVLLVGAGVITSIKGILAEGVRGLGLPAAVLVSEIVGLVGVAAGLAALLKPMNLMGAAIASLLGQCAATAALLVQVRWKTGYKISSLFWPWNGSVGDVLAHLLGRGD